MIEVGAVVVARLAAQVPTAAVYAQVLPEEVTGSGRAAISYDVATVGAVEGDAPVNEVQVEATSWGETAAAAVTLAQSVRGALDGFAGANADVHCGPLVYVGETQVYDESLPAWGVTMRWRCGVVRV